MPRWAVLFCNILVVAILATWGYFLKWSGPEFCAGLIVGFTFCYVWYKNWRQDYADEARANFTDRPEAQTPPLSQQRLFDP
jgi:4-hydroxybenzoate polyprenyltransferase